MITYSLIGIVVAFVAKKEHKEKINFWNFPIVILTWPIFAFAFAIVLLSDIHN